MAEQTRKEIQEILNKIKWSYSSINAFNTCPKMFYLQYINRCNRKDNAFAQYGTCVHKVLELYYSGNIELFDLTDEYKNLLPLYLTEKFPPSKVNLYDSYYNDGVNYFDAFEDPFFKYKKLGIEMKSQCKIRGYSFTGVIDLVLKSQDGLVIVDHKSKKGFASKEEESKYTRQLYLYAHFVKEKYNEFPYKMIFNTFRARKLIEIPFSESDYNAAISNLTDTIDNIYKEESWKDKIFLSYKDKGMKLSGYKKNDYFCCNICSCRDICNRAK